MLKSLREPIKVEKNVGKLGGAEKQQRKVNVGDGGGWYERITVTVKL